MDTVSEDLLGSTQPSALPMLVKDWLDKGAVHPTRLLNMANGMSQDDPERHFAVLTGLSRHSEPTERLVDALVDVCLAAPGETADTALAELRNLFEGAGPQEGDLRTRAIARMVVDKDHPLVVRFANESAGRVQTPRFWYLALRSAESIDDAKSMLTFAVVLSGLPLDNTAHLLNTGIVLLRYGKAQEVLDLIAANPAAASGAQAIRLRLDAELRLGRSNEDALVALQAAAAANPADVNIANLEAQMLISLGRPQDALAAYDRLPDERINNTMRIRYAKAQELAGDLDGAIATNMQVLNSVPDDKALRRKLVGLCVRAQKDDLARDLYQDGLVRLGSELSPSVSDNIDRILNSDCRGFIPDARAIWFEQVAKDAGRPLPQNWRADAGHVAAIDQFIVEYAQVHTDGVHQLADLVEVTPEAYDTLERGLQLGKGAFIASAHVGMLYAGPIVMNKIGKPFAYVASVPDLGQPGVSNGLISTSTNDVGAVGRRILMALRTNQPVAIAIDGAGTASTEVRKIFGKEARLSDFVPRIAARTKTPSYFPRITKSGTKAAFSLITLPAIEDGEEEAQFVARWLDFYAQQVEEFLLEHPEAMRGTGGIWTRLLDA